MESVEPCNSSNLGSLGLVNENHNVSNSCSSASDRKKMSNTPQRNRKPLKSLDNTTNVTNSHSIGSSLLMKLTSKRGGTPSASHHNSSTSAGKPALNKSASGSSQESLDKNETVSSVTSGEEDVITSNQSSDCMSTESLPSRKKIRVPSTIISANAADSDSIIYCEQEFKTSYTTELEEDLNTSEDSFLILAQYQRTCTEYPIWAREKSKNPHLFGETFDSDHEDDDEDDMFRIRRANPITEESFDVEEMC